MESFVINGFGGRVSGYNSTFFLFLTSSSARSICYSVLLSVHSFVFIPLILHGKFFSLPCTLFFSMFFLCSHSSPSLPSLHPVLHPSIPRGFQPAPRRFLSPFVDFLHLSRSPHRPLIFMRLAGPPRSASLSPSEREEAAYCQGLMDFWKTQTAMHHSLQKRRERGRIWSEA